MKNTWLTTGVVLGIGALMLFVSGLTATAASTSGYEVYKTALKNNLSTTSMTNTGSIAVTDNGTKVLGADFLAKIDRENQTMSVALMLGNENEEHAIEVYKQDNQIIFKDDKSDVYRQMIREESERKHDGFKAGPHKGMETVFDALMGDLKESATVHDTSDGGIQASLHLSDSQIPFVFRTLGSLAVSKLAEHEHGSGNGAVEPPHSFANLTENLPTLTENIQVQQLNLDAKISADSYLQHQTGEIIITGTDESGHDHRLVMTLDFHLTDLNNTVPEMIDLTGKQVEIVPQKAKRAPWSR